MTDIDKIKDAELKIIKYKLGLDTLNSESIIEIKPDVFLVQTNIDDLMLNKYYSDVFELSKNSDDSFILSLIPGKDLPNIVAGAAKENIKVFNCPNVQQYIIKHFDNWRKAE